MERNESGVCDHSVCTSGTCDDDDDDDSASRTFIIPFHYTVPHCINFKQHEQPEYCLEK